MELYYTNQASSLPYFSGHYRQRGSGFGALAVESPYRLHKNSFYSQQNVSQKNFSYKVCQS